MEITNESKNLLNSMTIAGQPGHITENNTSPSQNYTSQFQAERAAYDQAKPFQIFDEN